MLTIQRQQRFGAVIPDFPDLPDIPTIPEIPASVAQFPTDVISAMRHDLFQPVGQSFVRMSDGMRRFGTGFLVIMALGIGGWLTVRVLMGRPQLYFINQR